MRSPARKGWVKEQETDERCRRDTLLLPPERRREEGLLFRRRDSVVSSLFSETGISVEEHAFRRAFDRAKTKWRA